MEIVTLGAKAISNSGHEYIVTLEQKDGEEVILKVGDTPGQWFVSTLMGIDDLGFSAKAGKEIYIDHGQDWKIINFDEVMDEVTEKVFGKIYLNK